MSDVVHTPEEALSEVFSQELEVDTVENENHEGTEEDSRPSESLGATATVSITSATDDDDNWSRQVETDDIHRMSSSVLGLDDEDLHRTLASPPGDTGSTITSPSSFRDVASSSAVVAMGSAGLAPKRDEPTLKEKLVERERQRRVETKRARWKRQFALNGESSEAIEEDSNHADGVVSRENGSVAGTVGEGSTVAQIDPDLEPDGEKLPYPLERFLQEQEQGIEEDKLPVSPVRAPREVDAQNQGVLMERFLQEAPVVDPLLGVVDQPPSTPVIPSMGHSETTSVDQGLLEGENLIDQVGNVPGMSINTPVGAINTPSSLAGNASIGNTPGTSLTEGDNQTLTSLIRPVEDPLCPALDRHALQNSSMDTHPFSPTMDQSLVESEHSTRVLRLTAEEIQEMAAIEEASIGNAPPSERDDLSASSFVAELANDPGHSPAEENAATTLSQGTPTTVMESGSLFSGGHSVPGTSDHVDERLSIDGLATASISSRVAGSSDDGNISIAANPPSITGEPPTSPIPVVIHQVDSRDDGEPESSHHDHDRIDSMVPNVIHPVNHTSALTRDEAGMAPDDIVLTAPFMPPAPERREDDLERTTSAALAEGVVNRQIRPGFVNTGNAANNVRTPGSEPSTPLRRSMSMPDNLQFDLDGFDYDKHVPNSPASGLSSSIRDLPGVLSPGNRFPPSPFARRQLDHVRPSFGITGGQPETIAERQSDRSRSNGSHYLSQPIVPDLSFSGAAAPPIDTSLLGMALHELRQVKGRSHRIDLDRIPSVSREGTFIRQLFERFGALFLTVVVPCPLFLVVSEWSMELCALTGRTKYHLVVGFLLLSTAVCGRINQQSEDALYKTAIFPKENALSSVTREFSVVTLTGISVGACVGCLAAFLTDYDESFSVAIGTSQAITAILVGLYMIITPLLAAIILKGRLLKIVILVLSVVQPLLSAFLMTFLTIPVLEALGPSEIAKNDLCVLRAKK